MDKIVITKELSKFYEQNQYELRDEFLKMGDWYTNGAFALHKDLCELDQDVKAIKKFDNSCVEKMFKRYEKYIFINMNDVIVEELNLVVAQKYIDMLSELQAIHDNLVVWYCDNVSPLKLTIDGEIVGMIMPKVDMNIVSKQQQISRLLNDFENYIEEHNLICVEAKMYNTEEAVGFFVPKTYTDAQIKKMFKENVKRYGGRWSGRYEIVSGDRAKKLAEKFTSLDVAQKQEIIRKV